MHIGIFDLEAMLIYLRFDIDLASDISSDEEVFTGSIIRLRKNGRDSTREHYSIPCLIDRTKTSLCKIIYAAEKGVCRLSRKYMSEILPFNIMWFVSENSLCSSVPCDDPSIRSIGKYTVTRNTNCLRNSSFFSLEFLVISEICHDADRSSTRNRRTAENHGDSFSRSTQECSMITRSNSLFSLSLIGLSNSLS